MFWSVWVLAWDLKDSKYNDPNDKKRFINGIRLKIKIPLLRAGGGPATEIQMVSQYGQFSASCVEYAKKH
jgi:hypothetical protein